MAPKHVFHEPDITNGHIKKAMKAAASGDVDQYVLLLGLSPRRKGVRREVHEARTWARQQLFSCKSLKVSDDKIRSCVDRVLEDKERQSALKELSDIKDGSGPSAKVAKIVLDFLNIKLNPDA